MPSLLGLARSVRNIVPLSLVAAAGTAMMRVRGDPRRFEVDSDGQWVNRQPQGCFVSPEIHTAHYHQVAALVSGHWFHEYAPRPGDVVIDVGAGIGEDAVILSRLVGDEGLVHAIEAHPGTFQCLQATVEQSALRNVRTHRLAIMERDGCVTISDDAHHLANSILAGGEGIEVEGWSLDRFIESTGHASIDLLKMNIEGAERGAMLGLDRHAGKIRNVAISCHDFIADGGGGDQFRTKDAVRRRLAELGFRVRERSDATVPWEADVLFGDRH